MRSLVRILGIAFVIGSTVLPLFAQEADTAAVTTYTVQRGDTLFRIALRYGVDIETLTQANAITNASRIQVGQELIIPGEASSSMDAETVNNPLVAAAPIVHVVQRGETLAVIARLYHITADEILKANNIPDPNRIYPGQELQIWSADVLVQQEQQIAAGEANAPTIIAAEAVTLPAVDIAAPPVTEPQTTDNIPTPAPQAVTHVVAAGEHLSQIAARYGISWTTLAAANNIANPDIIYAGLTLTIPDASQDNIISYAPSIPAEPAPAYLGVGREVVVDLSTQMSYAYEDGVLKYSALSSTGLPGTPTVQGDFKVYLKYDAQTMSGPGYYLEGVEWVSYFYEGYALHGTYWHNNFGHPMSHGCVNLRNEDAKFFYDFAPIGTPVHVQW